MNQLHLDQIKDTPVNRVRGIGPARAKVLTKLGIFSLYDLLFYYPRAYEDARQEVPVSHVTPEAKHQVVGEISQLSEKFARGRRGLLITKALLTDGTGELGLIWFQQKLPTPSPIFRRLQQDKQVKVFGKVENDRGYLVMKNPEFDKADTANSLHLGRITPIYALTAGISQKVLRRAIRTALDNYRELLIDPLPEEVMHQEELMSLGKALEELHFPSGTSGCQEARRRLAFTQLLGYGLALQMRRAQNVVQGIRHSPPAKLIKAFLANIPFKPTKAQERAAAQIWERMAAPHQIEHLLMGDVGSGKTLVAALAILKTIEDGHQAAFMAPTSILAYQHFQSLSTYLEGLSVRIRLLLGDTPDGEKVHIYQELAEGRCDLVVGTHALLQEEAVFADLGLAVTDEQHRFGVEQRNLLVGKGSYPDVLIISATPIPRTLALAAYGELGYSVLDELPPGRQKVVTKWIQPPRLPKVWDFIRREAAQGFCGYVICSLVEENPELPGVKGVLNFAEELKGEPLANLSIGVLHGGMKEEEKAQVLDRFKVGLVQVLVSTTVVEIGVDVSTASFIVILNAERYGLAQLHQLRGRVGRGSRRSYCVLCSESTSDTAETRLRTMEEVSRGEEIAEADLKLRGPGEVFGLKQHGTEDIIFQTMLRHPEIHERAFAFAEKLTGKGISNYPVLSRYVLREYGRFIGEGEQVT